MRVDIKQGRGARPMNGEIEMEPEILVYGLEAGETRRAYEDLLSSKCKTLADVERVKGAAARDGYHSFRVTRWDGSPPDFSKVLA